MVRGRVVSISQDAVFVALGAKAEAMLELQQVMDAEGKVQVAVGDTIQARVGEIRNGQVVLRMIAGRGPEARAELVQAHQHGIPVEGLVTAAVKGGVEVQVAGMRAFCPISQLDNRFVQDPATFVGQRLQFRIIRYEPGRGNNANIVLSRRVILEEEAAARAAEIRAKLEVGAVLRGTVTTIKGYGAFVDLGGVEGMLHVSELGFGRIEHPSEVLSVGQTMDVQIIKIEATGDPKRPQKISLSLKALASDPWKEAADRFVEGARVRGKISRLQPFGAFVELMPGIEGLIHISELAKDRRVHNAREVVNVGDEVEAVVLGIEHERRRISLSLSAKEAQEEEAEVRAYEPPRIQGFGTLGDLLKKKI